MAAGGAGKLRQKRSTSAAVMRATSMRDGAFSRRLMVGCEQSAPPLSGAFPDASLNRGSARSVSQSSASSHGTGFAGPTTGSTAGDRQHAEAEHGRERVNHLRLIAPIPDTACQGLGEVQAAFRLAQQDEAAVGRDQTAIEGSSIRITLGRAQAVGILAQVGAHLQVLAHRHHGEDAPPLGHVPMATAWTGTAGACSRCRNWHSTAA